MSDYIGAIGDYLPVIFQATRMSATGESSEYVAHEIICILTKKTHQEEVAG